ncbi:MAG: hypothetical protein ACPGO5_04170 [Patescibacteria group bacterium]
MKKKPRYELPVKKSREFSEDSHPKSYGRHPEAIAQILEMYPDKDNHGREHIASTLKNLDIIIESVQKSEGISNNEIEKARLALALHDLNQRHDADVNIEEMIRESYADTYDLSEEDIHDITDALHNHSQPKIRWSNPRHLTSMLVYDCDKMDTVPERYYLSLDSEDAEYKANYDKYTGYVLMVRDSVSFDVTRSHLTEQLPPELKIDVHDQEVDKETIQSYYEKMHQLWQDLDLPAKRTAAKLCLQTAANEQFTRSIQEELGPRPDIDFESLSVRQREIVQHALQLESFGQQVLTHLGELSDLANKYEKSNGYNLDKLKEHITEKLFTYDIFIRAIESYPADKLDDLEALYERTPELLSRNYTHFQEQTTTIREEIGNEVFNSRKAYFKKLIGGRLDQMRHFARHDNFEALIAGRRILEQEEDVIKKTLEVDDINDLISKAIESGNPQLADSVLRFIDQGSLRAVDRVNDIFGTDNFIYFMLDKQTEDAPVWRLPHVYSLDQSKVSEHNPNLNYSNPTHPQALHVMKLHHAPDQMPEVMQKSIRMYTQGLYRAEDFHELYADIFALTHSEDEMDEELLDFIFDYVAVNEESPMQEVGNQRFVVPEWLEIHYAQNKHRLYERGQEAVEKINNFSSQHQIVPPLRPYVVVNKEIDLEAVGASISQNTLSEYGEFHRYE